jgi:hypothetical protein
VDLREVLESWILVELHIMVSFKRSLLRLALDFSLPDVPACCSLLLVLFLQDRCGARAEAAP